MTDSELTTSRVAGAGASKRERLVAAATQVLYQQGVEATTLADIAKAAGIPLGNVYYYFKTKNDIVAAVIDAHVRDIHEMLGAIDSAHSDPRARLKGLFAALAGQGELISHYGCPHGSLCQELGKRADAGVPDAARLVAAPIDWCERQFAQLGRRDARNLAVQTMAAYQGTALLTCALRDPSLLESESRRIAAWIDSVS